MKKLTKVLCVLGLLAASGCAGSLGWSSATALPRGSYDEERIDRVGPRRSIDPCGRSASSYDIPSGYMLVPAQTSSPCQ